MCAYVFVSEGDRPVCLGGGLSCCNRDQGIVLLDVAGRVFTSVVLLAVVDEIDKRMGRAREAAFNSVHGPSLRKILKVYGIPRRMIAIIKDSY